MTQDNTKHEFKSGRELLAAWKCKTREQKLERACLALMSALEEQHVNHEEISLEEGLDDTSLFCGCADAYRMGKEALK